MKLSYQNLTKNSRLIKTATGLRLKEFDYLAKQFEKEWQKYIEAYTFEGKPRMRKRKARKNNTFQCIEDKLIFILHDYRNNPTQEFMGLQFGITQPKVAMWIKVLEPLLAKSLKKLGLTPARDSAGLNNRMIESVTILLDGSERPINRPKYEQEEYYSGKKSNTR